MNVRPDPRVPLGALSASQQRRVEKHMPLVHLTLARHGPCGNTPGGRERQDLCQEGCLALLHAVRSHDPVRHGAFAPYAMARIHHAISRYAHEHQSAIRIPYITQRRHRKARRSTAPDRHRPDPLPRVVHLRADRASPSRELSRRLYARRLGPPNDGPTIGSLVGRRYLRAAKRAVRVMKRIAGRSSERMRIIDRCFAERWTIPDEEGRTPIRQIVRSLGCSLGGVTHCEARFRQLVAETLSADPAYSMLRRLARANGTGFLHRVTPAEWARLSRVGLTEPETGGDAGDSTAAGRNSQQAS